MKLLQLGIIMLILIFQENISFSQETTSINVENLKTYIEGIASDDTEGRFMMLTWYFPKWNPAQK